MLLGTKRDCPRLKNPSKPAGSPLESGSSKPWDKEETIKKLTQGY
jgi:hypothetical protein